MKKLLRKSTSLFMALFMVLQVMLPAFATKSKAEEAEPNSIKNIENLDQDPDSYFSLTDSQKIYDKNKKKKDENKFTIALGISDTSSNFRLVKRNDLKLYDDRYFPTNEEASKEYWKIKDKLKDQGLDIEIDIIKDDQGYKIVGKNQDQETEESPYGTNYSYIDFKVIDNFDFNEKGNQKLLEKEKLIFNLEFSQYTSPDPNYNLFEKDQDGNYEIKNHGQIFALIDNDKVNIYNTSSLANDFNELNQYREEKKLEDERKKQEEEKKADEERKAEEEKKAQEEAQKQKEEAEKKAQEEKAKAEEEKKLEEERKEAEEKEKAEKAEAEKEKEEAKKEDSEKEENSQAENKENQKEEKSVLEKDKKENKDEKSSDPKSLVEKKTDEKAEENLAMTNLEKADKELKEALKDKNKSIADVQKLLGSLGEKYKLSRLDQEKLMTDNDAAIKALVEKDREENFRPNMLRALASNSFEDKIFHLYAQMKVKATDTYPIPTGWYFDVKVGPYLYYSSNQPLNDLYFTGLGLVATAKYYEDGSDHFIRYTFIKPVSKDITLDIDQNLKFDTANISSKSVDIDIKVAPKNNPVQSMKRKTVNINDPSPVESSFEVIDQGETQSGTYPYQLDWETTSQTLKDKDGNPIDKLATISPSQLQGAYVEWNIEVDTAKLIDTNNPLTFNNLNLTVFGSAKQGLTNIYYKASKNETDLNTIDGYTSSTNLGEILSQSSFINKNELGDKLYIKVKATIDPNQAHDSYSIGFRLNPDQNYIDNLLTEYEEKLKNLPTSIKWLKGAKEARRFAEVPFNLVETNIPATFIGLGDKFTNERFYYDNTRTIVANRKADSKTDWYALDLIRRGETQDPALDNPTFDINNGKNNQTIKPRKVYFVPLKDGGYRKTYQAGDVVLSNGQYYPGTIVSYEYVDEKGGRNDTYNFRADLKDKKKFNIDESYDTEGGRINLFTEKVSNYQLKNGYLVYTEDPYPIMRINRNFDMVSCFNDRVSAPVFTGNNGVFLDMHEDVSGDYLIGRLNESIGNPSGNYRLIYYLTAGNTYDGVNLNHDGMSQGQAMEELMKKIYFYGEEIKKEYSKQNNGQEMHRLIESSMYQRVVHHFTDNKSLAEDYFGVPSNYNVDEWKVDHTLSGIRQTYPKTGWDGSFAGSDTSRRINNEPGAPRKLKDKETRIKNYPPVQSTQYEMAQKLYNKVIASYSNKDWNDDKANSVKLVFYSHTDTGKWQELITGRVMEPIEIDKYKKGGTKLAGVKFRFTNIDTGERKIWTSTEDDTVNKLYLKPGRYKVQEIDTPQGYEKVEDFDITVKRTEIYPDDGPYRAKKLPSIHVNDGFKTELVLTERLAADGKTKLIALDDTNKLKIKVTNIEDNLGKLEFIKKNKFIKLNGAEFRLRKIEAADLKDAKNKFNTPATLTYDSKYDKTDVGVYGEFKFDQIPAGFYVLEETKVPTGYEKAPLYLLEAKEITDANQKKKVEVSFVQEYKEVTNEKGEKESKIADAKLEKEKSTRDGKDVYLPIIRNKTKKIEIKFRKVRTENLDTTKEHLGLAEAKFRLMSLNLVDGDFYLKEDYTDHSKATQEGTPRVDGQQARGGGYITFEGLKAGEYLLEELQAPKGYKKTDLYGWKLVVSEIKEGDNKGELEYKLYEIPKGTNVNEVKTSELKQVKLDEVINGNDRIKAFQIGNTARTIDIPFKKYKGKIVEKDGKTEVEATEVKEKLTGKNGKPVSFNLYKSDFYGAIISDKDKDGNYIPLNKEPIIQDENGIFHLEGLEFGGYYILRETNPPKDYKKADDITLKVEAEAIADEGKMKVIVRDPNTNAKTDLHSVFKGVVDFEEGAKLGKFSIKKVGNAIGAKDKNGNPIRVGLRRAYFRLYTADENYKILMNGPYPKEYIQKVTPGVPITKDDGKGGQTGKTPEEIEAEAPNQGIVTFDQLKPGKYVLEEFRGPAGYEKDPGKWYILVETDGTVKKYRDNPATSTKPRTMDYSTQSMRFKMAGLDISEPIKFNSLMARPSEAYLQALEYDSSSDNLNIKVKSSDVDTSDGKRTIDLSISPKDQISQENRKNLQYVFLIDRSQDTSTKVAANAPTIDKNINKFLTDLAEKAKNNNANVDVTFIEYSRSIANNYDKANKNKTKLLGTYNQDLVSLYDKASNFTYNMKTQGLNDNNLVEAKDILGQVGISQRETIAKTKDDGSRGLKENINTHYNQIISNNKKYDKRIVLNIANFEAASADYYLENSWDRNSKKFYIADNNWPFRDPGKTDKDKIFDSYVLHIEQKSRQETDYEKYMRTNSGTWHIDKNENPQQGLFTYKNFLESNLMKDEYFISNSTDDYLVKNASLNIILKEVINLVDASAKIDKTSLNPILTKSGVNHSAKLEKINLKKGQTLDFSYTINLKKDKATIKPENNRDYDILESMTFYNNGKDTAISRHDSTTNKSLKTKIVDETTPDPTTYSIKQVIEPIDGGTLTIDKTSNLSKGENVNITATPNQGYKLVELKAVALNDPTNELELREYRTRAAFNTTDSVSKSFIMPASNVTVTARFEKTAPTGNMTVRANFIYTNQKDGIDDSKTPPDDSPGKPGTIKLQVNNKNLTVDNWVDVSESEKPALFKGVVDFTNLDSTKEYRLVYTRDTEIAGGWGTDTITEIPIDWTKADKDNIVRIDITNGNLTEIFNHDETGFRIPLRISKVNENKAALTGSQFKARKIINGEKVKIYEKDENGQPKYTGKVDYPKYYNEKFDGVSEATGKPGDNYFRELTPGIYELTEIKTPNDSYRLPKDKDGKDMKWYFKVVINDKKVPSDANYMDIEFNFEHTFSANDDFSEIITEEEKKALIGTIIKGFTKGDPDFARYIEKVDDDGRSDPARPDAPYKWIHDARVTNYRNKTSLSFMKKDKDTHRNIAGAEFSLRKAKLDEKGNLVFENNKPAYEPEKTTGSDGTALTEDQLDLIRVQPYYGKLGYAKATSTEKLGVEFTNIEAGTYILEEIKPADGYKPTDSFIAITFTEDDDGSWKQVVKGYENGEDGKYKEMPEPNNFISKDDEGKFISVNNDKNFIDLKFQKIEGNKDKDDNEIPVESADFKLTQVDRYGNKVEGGYEKTIYSYANSNFEFKNLGVGRYKLEETRAITKFEKPDPWFFNVDQDKETYKLKIVFEKDFNGKLDESIGFKEDKDGKPIYDADGNLQDIKIRNYSKTKFSFQKLKNEIGEDNKKLPLKDAYFRLKKVRYSMDPKSKAYEYYGEKDGASLKKYTNGKKVTEYDSKGKVTKYTYDGEVVTEGNENYKPDAISNATGKYSSLRRSQSTGRVDFQNLGEGIYELEEVGIPEGYQSDKNQSRWIFEVKKTDNGLVVERNVKTEENYFKTYDNDYYTKIYSVNNFANKSNIEDGDKNFSYKITNTKTTTDLKWKKIGSRNTDDIVKKNTKFVLLKTSANPDDIDSAKKGQSESSPYQVESSNGTFEIKDLAKGVYLLIESQAPEGYEKMTRKIAIKVYEDTDGSLKKKFYELNANNELVENAGIFEALLNRNATNPEVHTDKDGTFYVINKSKPYFFNLSKGFMDNGKFTNITKGKLRVKISKDPADTSNTDNKVYEQTIDLSDKGSYRIDLTNDIQLGRDYILEEVESPDGFAKTKYKYRLQFSYDRENSKFAAVLKAVLDENGKPLKNSSGQNITDSDQLLAGGQAINTGFPFRIVNKKTEVEFTKFGEDEKAKDGKKPLEGVGFYLEKQDPDDIQKKNQGYYPLTKNMEMIKPEKNADGNTTYYYIDKETGEKVTKVLLQNVTPENSRKIYTSNDKGKFTLTDLTDGYYRIIEPEAPEYEKGKKYMKVNGPIKRFRVVQGKVRIFDKDENGNIVEKEVDNKNIETLGKIINEKPGKGEFKLTKVDEKDNPMENVIYTLHKTDADETQVGGDYTTDSKGEIQFKDLPFGYYWLKETKTLDGYVLDTKKKLIALGGGDWGETPAPKKDVSTAITFDEKQAELVSTEDSKRTSVVYPNKAEGMFAKFKFKINPKSTIEPGDYFTINFSDNVDLDGINKDNQDIGQKDDSIFNIIGPAGLLAEAKVNDDRRSITYTFTNYVKDYKPDFMSMYLQLFANRRKVDHKQDIEVTADIGNSQSTDEKYHYSDYINIDYRGENSHTDDNGNTVTYDGYQNPNADVSSYMLRLNPDGKTFTAILYLNPWNREMLGKTLSFTTDEDILVNNNLSVKTYIKNGAGSHTTEDRGWQDGDLPDSYDIYEKDENGNLKVRSDLSLISDSGDEYNWYPTKTWTETVEVNSNQYWDFWKYDAYGYARYYRNIIRDNSDKKITRKIDIPARYLNRKGDSSTATYVIEIKGELNQNAKSLKTRADETHYNYRTERGITYKDSYKSNFETWSQFFNPGGIGDVNKEIKLVNFKNKIEFAKVDGGVISNVVDKSEENPQNLKDLGIGNPLKGAEFKLVKDGVDLDNKTRISDDNGIFSWEGLAPGNYEVIEIKSPDKDKYDLPKDAISTFKVDKDGNIVDIKNNKQILENYRKAEIKIRKTDQEGKVIQTGKDLAGAEFTLTPKSGQKNPEKPSENFPVRTLTTDETGIVTFDKLVAGKYELQEMKAPTGYTKSKKVWELEVTKDGKVKWLNSFDDTNDQMKAVTGVTYSGDNDKENLKSEILGIDESNKTFRQKITIKAKPSELEKARLILDSTNDDLKLSQTNTKVRLVQVGENNNILEPDNTTYTVEINNVNIPNLTLRINPPYREEKKNNPVGSSQENNPDQTSSDDDKVREYQFIVDMPYKDDTRIGAKATYQIGSLNENGKVDFNTILTNTDLDIYVEKSNLTISKDNVIMKSYENNYLARDINLLTTDIGNIKNPNIYFKKVDADTKKALEGAEFKIQRKNDKGDFVDIKTNGEELLPSGTNPSDQWTATSGDDGTFAFENIPIDGEYRIVETKSPSGYVLFKEKDFKFRVENGKIYYINTENSNISKIQLKKFKNGEEIADNNSKNRLLVTNKKAQYPSTGGPGVWIGFMVIGLMVMFTSVLTYFKRKDKLVVRK